MAIASRSRRRWSYVAASMTAVLGMSGCAISPLINEHPPPAWVPPVPWTDAKGTESKSERPAEAPKLVDQGGSGFASEVEEQAEPVKPATIRAPVPEPAPAAPTLPPPSAPAMAEPVSSNPSVLPVVEAPQSSNIKLRGRIEAESVSATQSEKNKALFGNYENAVGFRRARIGSEGTMGEQTHWVAEFDFAGGDIRLRDAFLGIRNLPFLREVRIGNIREPFTLEGLERSDTFPIVERSPSYTFDPARNWGVAAYSYTDDRRLVVQAGVFKSGTDSNGTDSGDGNDLAITARIVAVPWYDDSGDSLQVFHIGGAASQRRAKDSEATFNQGPQDTLLDSGADSPIVQFAPSLTIPANYYQLYNLQSALILGPLSFQAEFSGTRVEQIGAGPVNLNGWYALASYFLTGEHRTYDRDFGTVGGPIVRRPFVCTDGPSAIGQGPGAWEFVARVAYLNFDSPNLPRLPNGQPAGTRQLTMTIGINWYLTSNARLMLDYGHAVVDYPPFGQSTGDVVTFRSAIFW